MLGEFRPACETVAARDEELRVGQGARGGAFVGLLELLPAPLHAFRFVVDLSSKIVSDLAALEAGKVFAHRAAQSRTAAGSSELQAC